MTDLQIFLAILAINISGLVYLLATEHKFVRDHDEKPSDNRQLRASHAKTFQSHEHDA